MWNVTAQHRELVVQHQDLQILVGTTACGQASSRIERHSIR
jgi:hypothetical protein